MPSGNQQKRVAIVGGGLVGALNACFMARRNYKVELYEMRPDSREMEIVRGRSINLAVSERGRAALRQVGLEERITSHGIPMYARMIHDPSGKRRPIPYGRKTQYIMSIDRRDLNEVLLTEAEKWPNVTLHFNHRLVGCDFEKGEITLEQSDGSHVHDKVDLIIGTDGAYSGVRREMMKNVMLNYQQDYIPHGYMELNMPPTANDEFAMEVNYLHIWPREEYMMIALPNLDKTYTVTLFMPFEMFNSMKTPEELMTFFRDKYPDSIQHLGEENLKKTFFSTKASPLVTVRCSPYHVGKNCLIMGDAAHAMVPFYGQGMNAGFEDCIILNDLLDKHHDNLEKVLEEFTSARNADAKAICDLALNNYIEMRKSVNSRLFLMRKKLDNFLHWLFPQSWVPLYTMVSFTRIRYQECILKRRWQDKVLTSTLSMGAVILVVCGIQAARKASRVENFNFHDTITRIGERLQPMWNRLFS